MVTVSIYCTLIKGNRRRLLRNYVGVHHRPDHAPSNPAMPTTVNEMQKSFANHRLIGNNNRMHNKTNILIFIILL